MPPVDRNNPSRAASSDSRISLMEFMRDFPDDAACLDYQWRERWSPDGTNALCPKCEKVRPFKRYAAVKRPSYTCTGCGHHINPTAGTIFHKSSTSLHIWFYAIYLMAATRCGVSAKQIERETGVTYKTAWRILFLIRNDLMNEDEDPPLSGEVEADETYMGGKARAYPKMTREQHLDRKTPVFAAVERKGRVVARVMTFARGKEVWQHVNDFILPSSMLFTDDARLYDRATKRYKHKRIKHQQRIYVDGDVHTQTIDGFFSLVKNGIRGTYHSVSRKRLQGYLNEFAWRYNHRDDAEAQFRTLIRRAAHS
jgi:transposase